MSAGKYTDTPALRALRAVITFAESGKGDPITLAQLGRHHVMPPAAHALRTLRPIQRARLQRDLHEFLCNATGQVTSWDYIRTATIRPELFTLLGTPNRSQPMVIDNSLASMDRPETSCCSRSPRSWRSSETTGYGSVPRRTAASCSPGLAGKSSVLSAADGASISPSTTHSARNPAGRNDSRSERGRHRDEGHHCETHRCTRSSLSVRLVGRRSTTLERRIHETERCRAVLECGRYVASTMAPTAP